MVRRDVIRQWVASNLAPIIFLSAYFFTVVLGNILYTLSPVQKILREQKYTAQLLEFDSLFSPGYWALLFLPFLVTPIFVFLVRRVAVQPLGRLMVLMPDIRKIDFAVMSALCAGLVLFAMFRADAFYLFSSGMDAISSVEARFQIRAEMGFLSLVVLMSILHFLSIYAFVKCMREPDIYWWVVSICHVTAMTIFLVLLNMKWPVLIYYAGLLLSIFVYARRWAYPKTVAGAVLLVALYLLIASFVFRLSAIENVKPGSTAVAVAGSAFENAPMLIFSAVNRMAVIYPYYYELSQTEGVICGGFFEQLRFGQPCRPSTYVYTNIFGIDGFEGRGTSPASAHVTGYALGGWGGALFAVILGMFASLPLDISSTVGAIAITGAVTGYHFSQLPGEGPLLYDHGVVWSMLFVLVYAFCRILIAFMKGRRSRRFDCY